MLRKYWPVFVMIVATLGYILYDKNVNARLVLTPHLYGNGKVKVIEYADFECPYCNAAYPIWKRLREKYRDKMVFEYRHIFTHTEKSILMANAAECANEQGKFWEFHNKLYEAKEKNIETTARAVGIWNHRFRVCVNKGKYVNILLNKSKKYFDSGIKGTPTIVIETKPETVIRGLRNEAEYVRILGEILHEKSSDRR